MNILWTDHMNAALRHWLLRLRNRHYWFADLALLSISPLLALLLRIDSISLLSRYLGSIAVYTAIILVWKPVVFWWAGLYNRYWPYASIDSMVAIVKAAGAVLLFEVSLYFLVLMNSGLLPAQLPMSLPLLSAAVSAVLVAASRLGVRTLFEFERRNQTSSGETANILVAGAGVVGSMVMKELRSNPQLGLVPKGFLDDDPRKQGLRIHGMPVLGPLKELREIASEFNVKEVVIAMPNAPGRVVRMVDRACKEAGVRSKTVPGMFDLLAGTAKVSQIRDIQIEDLLRRGIMETDSVYVTRLLAGKRVMVTGAGGSIGSELCRQILNTRPAELVLLGHGENSIFGIANELRKHPLVENGEVQVHPVIADIRDEERMGHVFDDRRPQIIFHAAAHKHVGLMEANLADAVSNNVLGTLTLVDLAVNHDVERFVMISSDKAVNPTSIMGVTKRIAELIVQDAAQCTGKTFVSVRFGNVLGSRGSVLPIFKAQIAAGGPVTITHPEVTRFFMTIPEAVQLVLQAGTLGTGSEVFVLDMGEPVRIADLARDVIRLSGFVEGRDIEIVYTGLKQGEKMNEELFYEDEEPRRSLNPKIFVCRSSLRRSLRQLLSGAGIAPQTDGAEQWGGESQARREVERLIVMAAAGTEEEAIGCVRRLVPEYQGRQEEAGQQGNGRKTLTAVGQA